MNGMVMGALLALGMTQQTDTVFPLQNGTLLDVESDGGVIVVTGWDRNEIRVQATHSSRTFVTIRRARGGETIEVESDAQRGPAGIADFQISVPRGLALNLDGMYTDITVDGSNGVVEADTQQGDIIIRGGRGTIQASSSTGDILFEGAEGAMEAETSAGNIRFVNVGGDVIAESSAGNIIFENARATSVDAGSTGGRLQYQGTLQRTGRYFFGSHSSSVTLIVPEGTGANLNLATIHGSITSNLSGEMERLEGGRRHSLAVGGGGALVEIETFGGRIAVMRQGTEGALRNDDRSEEHGIDVALHLDHLDRDLEDLVHDVMDEAMHEVGEAMEEVELEVAATNVRVLSSICRSVPDCASRLPKQ